MPYKLRKAPKRDLYWVVNKDNGKKYSKDPLPIDNAKAQMRALYANESKSGGQIPTFNEYLAARGFNKAPSPTTEVAPGQFVANTSPTDRIVFDKKRYDELMALAPSKAKWEASYRRRGITPNQTYDDYMKSYEKIQRQRSTSNATQQERVNASMSNLGDQNALYAEYIAQYPDQQDVMCDFNEAGDRIKTRTSQGQCRQNHATGMAKWERENRPENYYFFRPAVNALAKTTSFLSDIVPMPPIVKDIAKGVASSALEANSYNPVMKGGMDRPKPLAPCEGEAHTGETTLSADEVKTLKDMLEDDDADRSTVLNVYRGLRPTLNSEFDLNVMDEVKAYLESGKKDRRSTGNAINLLVSVLDRVFPRSGGLIMKDRPKPYSRPVNKEGMLPEMEGRGKDEHPVAYADRVLKEPTKYTKKQLRNARRIKKLEGAGFFGDLWNAAKSVGQKVVSTVKNVVSGRAIREDYPPYVRGLLREMGDRPIAEMYVRRDPIQSLLNSALNFISRGKWNEVRSKYSYDKLFHLGLEVVVKVSEQDNIYKRFVMEKNEVIEITTAKAFTKDTEIMPVSMGGQGHTMNSLLNGAKQIMGGKFFTYDPFYNNCQDFIMSLLLGSGIGSESVYKFVKQPIDQLVSELPSYTGKIAKTLTDIGGVVNTAIYGQGGLKPSREMGDQFKKWGVDPADYLAEAKRKAKALGLADNMLGFSSDSKHKLQIPNEEGRVIRFGAVGLGDYILYTLSKDKSAEKHRKHYLQRATKIKGDWKKDPYSPNSLAIGVLW